MIFSVNIKKLNNSTKNVRFDKKQNKFFWASLSRMHDIVYVLHIMYLDMYKRIYRIISRETS